MRFKKYKKIIFLAAILGITSFAFVFFYNREGAISAQKQWEWICQDEEMEVIMQYFEEGEIPIGEAADGTLAMAKEIIRNYDLMLPAAGQIVVAANKIYDLPLPDACSADNCDTGCWMTYDENCWGECDDVLGAKCDPDPDECPFQQCIVDCADVSVSKTGLNPPGCSSDALPGTCVCAGGVCLWIEKGDFCESGKTCNPSDPSDPTCVKIQNDPEVWVWGDEECGQAGICTVTSCNPVICPMLPPWNCCWMSGTDYCWEHTGDYCDCGDACPPGEPFCYDVGTQTKCWGDNECADKNIVPWGKCEEKCEREFDCGIVECNGNACPIDAVVELGNQRAIITDRALHVAGYADAINTEVQKSPGLQALLTKARRGLKACATPASSFEPSEAVQLIETLVSCRESKFAKILSQDQEDCYKNNFFCCEPMQ